MTTDAMILALVATGKFTLPEGLAYDAHGVTAQFWKIKAGEHVHPEFLSVPTWRYAWHQSMVHDLCAMHFAREADVALCGVWPTAAGREEWCWATEIGNSEAAIRALYDAVVGVKP